MEEDFGLKICRYATRIVLSDKMKTVDTEQILNCFIGQKVELFQLTRS
jgi:hypothetical protein